MLPLRVAEPLRRHLERTPVHDPELLGHSDEHDHDLYAPLNRGGLGVKSPLDCL